MPSLAHLLLDHREQIVARFVAEVQRKDLSPPGLPESRLVDRIPDFLGEIVAELTRPAPPRSSHPAMDTSASARQHGEQRWGLGYQLQGLIREYDVLRACILHVAREHDMRLSLDEFDVLSRCLNVGVAEAVTQYVHYQDEQMLAQQRNLQFLAEAGQLLSSSLDYRSTLSRLTGLLVPHVADWCAVYLEGSDDSFVLAHVDPAKRELLEQLYRRFPPPIDFAGGHLQVARTGKPHLVTAVEPGFLERVASDPEQLALMHAIDSCSWITVPLQVQQHVLGSLVLAYSESRRHYGPGDLAFASEIARRAAVAIDNARLYERSQHERSRVEAATLAKDEFISMVSHELRTPLNAILGWTQVLRGGPLDEPRRQRALEVIERNAQAQYRLVADLIDSSQIFMGKLRLRLSGVDLGAIVEAVVDGMRPATEAKQIGVSVQIEGPPLSLRGDGERLQQVVWNLLSNAVKFTPRGGQVRVSLRRLDEELELAVEDNGEGITAGFLPHVFEVFRQADGGHTRPHGGLGLGLSIVKHVVELHGGSIEARSPGKARGATFVVRLPIHPLTSLTTGAPAARTEPPPAPATGAPARLRVLVVDDEPDARELVAFALEARGMDVTTAERALEALELLETYTPDVLISDIGMPEEDGYALIRKIRTLADSARRNLPAIALTAFARNEDRTRALVAGFNRHLTKPVDMAVLVQTVGELVGPRG